MTLSELEQALEGRVDLDVAQAFEEYRQRSGREDCDGFLEHLRGEGLLSVEDFVDLHSASFVEVTRTSGVVSSSHALPFHDASEAAGQDSPARYDLIGHLGAGAMGSVLMARDVRLRRKVAYKTILPELSTKPPAFERFLNEVQITAQLEHPNIVPIYGLEVAPDGTVAYAMKLVRGRELRKLITETHRCLEKGQALDEEHRLERRIDHFIKVCDAVAFAHSRGIVHRDLKPANIMLGRFGEVYLMDWGLARLMDGAEEVDHSQIELDERSDDVASRTRVGQVLGTPLYLSPEQAAGQCSELDGRSDQYTLGLILQELVTLERAAVGRSLHDVVDNARRAVRAPLDAHLPGVVVPRELAGIIARATALSPADRYDDVAAMADDLRRYGQGDEVMAAPDNWVQRVGRWMSKHRSATLALLGSVVLVAAVVVTIVGFVAHERTLLAGAAEREQRVTQLILRVGARASAVDRQLHRYEAELEYLTGTMAALLADGQVAESPGDAVGDVPTPSVPVVWASEVGQSGGAASLGPSAHYGRPISLAAPVFFVAPRLGREALVPDAATIARLTPSLLQIMLDSEDDDAHRLSSAEQRHLIAVRGVPIRRVHVVLENGLAAAYPTMAGGAGGDMRQRPFYLAAKGTSGNQWGAPYRDENGETPVIACSTAIYDGTRQFRGVVAIELSVAFVRDELLPVRNVPYVEQVMVLGPAGRVLVAGAGASSQQLSTPIAIPEVLAAVRDQRGGLIEVSGGAKMAMLRPLTAAGWFYLAVADTRGLLEAPDVPLPAPSGHSGAEPVLPRTSGATPQPVSPSARSQ